MPIELDEICLRALAAAKQDRYGDCDEMRMALQSWLATNAPTTDGTRMSTFLHELFSEDIVRERIERAALVNYVSPEVMGFTTEVNDWAARTKSRYHGLQLSLNRPFQNGLLLKGAYTQSRIRQMIFGGATRHIIMESRIPVIMAR